MVQVCKARLNNFFTINLKFVTEKFARMKKMPYLCNRYNKHTNIHCSSGTVLSHRTTRTNNNTSSLNRVDYV